MQFPEYASTAACRECRSEIPHLRTTFMDEMQYVDCRSEVTGEIPPRADRPEGCPLTEYEERTKRDKTGRGEQQ